MLNMSFKRGIAGDLNRLEVVVSSSINFFSITAQGMDPIFGVDIKCGAQIHV